MDLFARSWHRTLLVVPIAVLIAPATTGMKAYNMEALELHNVRVNADSGPAFLVRDSKDLELDAVSTLKPLLSTPVVRLDRCPGAIVRGNASKAVERWSAPN